MTNPRRAFWLAFLLSTIPLLGWWTTGLFDLDEGFYAAATAEMNRRGEWITPYYNGEPWYEKPILLYWIAKPSVTWFGEAVGPRLPSVLATVATILLIGAFAKRRFALPAAAPAAMLFYGGCLLAVAVGRMMLTDALLVLTFTAAMLSFWESLVGDPRWRLATALCLGLAVLAKGPVALLLFAVVAMIAFARERDLRQAFRGQWLGGTAILAAVTAAWYWPAYAAGGETFVREFLVNQNLGRFTGSDAAHSVLPGPSGLAFYPIVLLLGALPWILWLPSALRTPAPCDDEAALRRYLGWWAAAVVVLFSISSAKLPHYVLPALPPIILLVAPHLASRWRHRTLTTFAAIWILCVAAIAQVGTAWWYRQSGQAEAHALTRWVRQKGGAMLVYQLPRRDDAPPALTKLQETSLPSLSFVLDAVTPRISDWPDLARHPGGAWVFTRAGRLTEVELRRIRATGRTIEPTPTGPEQRHFSIYRLD